MKIDLQAVSSPEILATTAPNVIRCLIISSFIVIIHHHDQHHIIVINYIIIIFVIIIIIIIIIIIVIITMIVTNINIADKFWDKVREMQPFCGGRSGQCSREYISPGEKDSRFKVFNFHISVRKACFTCGRCKRPFPTGERVTFTGKNCLCQACIQVSSSSSLSSLSPLSPM